MLTAGAAPSASWPLSPLASSLRSRRPAAAAPSDRSAYGRNARPASESRIPRPERMNRREPSSCSSPFNRAVSVGCVTKSASAARLTLRRCATSMNACSCSSLIDVFYSSNRNNLFEFITEVA